MNEVGEDKKRTNLTAHSGTAYSWLMRWERLDAWKETHVQTVCSAWCLCVVHLCFWMLLEDRV